jgi:proteasome lid subunit RPN8/RPN11
VRIPRALVDELIEHAREDAPNECCGMIGGRDGEAITLHRTRNAEASPYRYSIDGQELIDTYNEIEAAGQELVAIYHSHTASAPVPSQTDINLAGWPDAVYLIVSLQNSEDPQLKGFFIRDQQVTEAEVEVV